MPRVALRLAGLLAAVALAGCGQENPKLIPLDRADALTAKVDEIGQACANGDRSAAQQAIQEANVQVNALPRKVDRRLKANIRAWLNHIQDQLDTCKKPSESPTASPTATETPSATKTPTSTKTPSPTETPSPTKTPTATETPSASPPVGGGVPAPGNANSDDGQG